MCIDNYCSEHRLLEAYRDNWKSLSLRLLSENRAIEDDRNHWRRLFIQMYQQNAGVTDEMMWAYRNEMEKA